MIKTFIIDTPVAKIRTKSFANTKELAVGLEEALNGFFTTAGRFDTGDLLLVADNGANEPELRNQMFTVPHYPEPLFGRGVIVGVGEMGQEVDAMSDEDWLIWNVKMVEEFNPDLGVLVSTPFAQHPRPETRWVPN